MDNVLLTALQQMLLFLPLGFGIYLTYCVMNTTDLTVEATFVLGAAVFARLVSVMHFPTAVATLLALVVPAFAGLAVALMRKVAKIDSLIASVLAIYMLYTINFKVMGRPNLNLLGDPLFLLTQQHAHPLLVWGVIAAIVIGLMVVLVITLHSRIGLLLRAVGINTALAKSLGEPCFRLTVFGLMLSNALAALSGMLTAQINGYADINMGVGMALTAIGAMMIGMSLFRRHHAAHFNAALDLLACAFGVFVYFMVLNILLYLGVDPIYLKLLLGLMLIFFLSSAVRGYKGGQRV